MSDTTNRSGSTGDEHPTGAAGLHGKVVLVTGAASGIGLACADRIDSLGGTAVRSDLPDTSTDPAVRPLDVTDEEATQALIGSVVAEHGRLDGLVTAAGVAGGGPMHAIDEAEWRRVIEVNLTGTFLGVRHAVDAMLAQDPIDGQRGSIVTIASVEGMEGTAGGSAYNASKGGVILLTKNVAIDYGGVGIRANAVCPGFIDTPMLRSVFDLDGMQEIRSHVIGEHKLRRLGTPEEIAGPVTFLLSADSSFVTGHSLVVDGGYTAGRDHGVTDLYGL